MSRRELGLLVSFIVGLALVVVGVALWSVPVAFVVAGAGVVAVGVVTFAEVGT